jgi:PhnB protein
MTETTTYIPAGLGSVSAYLLVSNVGAAIDFYSEVFGATEIMRHIEGQQVVHAKIRIGNSVVELGCHGDRTARDVTDLPSVGVHLYVQDVDSVLAQASARGASTMFPIADQPYGDREVSIVDPYGVVWFVATHLHD